MIVNTDADNQYYGADIEKLVAPIVAGDADMVIGDRETDQIEHFSPLKKRLQRLGSAVVRRASGTNVPDTTSGFRAYNREAALQIQVVSKFTYTLETIIQAGKHDRGRRPRPDPDQPDDARVAPVPLDGRHTCAATPSRSSGSTRSTSRCVCSSRPASSPRSPARSCGCASACSSCRANGGHIQSLILGSTLFIVAVQFAALGVLGDILAGSRVLQQRILERVRRVELHLGVEPSHYEPGASETGQAHHRARSGRATGKTEERRR